MENKKSHEKIYQCAVINQSKEEIDADWLLPVDESLLFEQDRVWDNWTKKGYIKEGNKLSDSIKYIPNSAFYFMPIKEITLPPSVMYLGRTPFHGSKIEKIEILSDELYIDDSAFCGCSNLKEIVLPASVKYLGNNLFGDTNISADIKSISILSDDVFIEDDTFTGCEKATIICSEKLAKRIKGKNGINNKKIKKIAAINQNSQNLYESILDVDFKPNLPLPTKAKKIQLTIGKNKYSISFNPTSALKKNLKADKEYYTIESAKEAYVSYDEAYEMMAKEDPNHRTDWANYITPYVDSTALRITTDDYRCYADFWKNLLSVICEDDVLKKIIKVFPKCKNKTLNKRTTLYIACNGIVDSSSKVLYLTATAKNDFEIAIKVAEKSFNEKLITTMKNDLFNTGDIFRKTEEKNVESDSAPVTDDTNSINENNNEAQKLAKILGHYRFYEMIKWMSKYEHLIDYNCNVSFEGKLFACITTSTLCKLDIYDEIIARGGKISKVVYSDTDYFILPFTCYGNIQRTEELIRAWKNYSPSKEIRFILPTSIADQIGLENRTTSAFLQEMLDVYNKYFKTDIKIPPTSSAAPKKTGVAKKEMSTQSNTAADKTAARKESDAKLQAILDEQRENATVNMYIILTNEKKLGKLRRNQNEFYDLYKKHLVFFTKKVLFQTRKSIIEEMKDESRCSYYAKKFMQRSVEERFKISTKNLFDVDDEPDLDKMADWAIRNTKEWYREDEYFKVRKLMDSELLNARLELDKANKGIDLRWTKFALAKDNCLRIEINDELLMSGEAPKDLSKTDYSYFEVRVGEQLVSVRLQSNRIYTAPVLRNIYVWYWNVTVRDIWEAAALNEIYNFSRASISQRSVVNQAMNIIRSKYPDMKTDVLSSAEKSKAQEARPQYGYTETDKTNTVNSAPQYSQPLQQPEQKEGCYIATAVYGSYDAPEVIILRRFRDESLKKSALGRAFISAYYKFSPSVAERLKNAKRTNAFVRSILDKWVRKLSNK